MKRALNLSPKTLKVPVRTLASLTCVLLLIPKVWAQQTGNDADGTSSVEQMDFNPGFIHGASIDVSQFREGNPVTAGIYPLNVLVNGEQRGRFNVHFLAVQGKANAEPSFTAEELTQLGIKPTEGTLLESGKAYRLSEAVKGSQTYYNSGDLELSIGVPQINQVIYPRGYVDPARWSEGDIAGFLDYNANIYGLSTGPDNGESRSDDYTSNIGLLTGFNIAGWRIRQRSNTGWSKEDSTLHTSSLATYAATDLTRLKSQLTLGDSNTTGNLFDSFNLRGVQLQSDDRMLPEGLRNYSPILRGIAQTNARVTITQHGLVVYQTIVPPGPFELNDIGAMGYGGDLQMTIAEADGSTRISNIPFSAPPMLLHKDVANFEVAVGEMNDDSLKEKPKLAQLIMRYGLGNHYTLYGGSQVAEHYHALSVGNAINTLIGGVSFDLIRAWAEVEDGKESNGNSYSVAFTKFMSETSTNLTLAAYRYSTKGYYSLRDASIARDGRTNDDYDVDYRTKSRFSASVSQTLWDNSTLNFSGSLYSYWTSDATAKQYSLTWSKSLRYFSFALTAMRTSDEDGDYENSVMASVNVPLSGGIDSRPLFSSIYSTYSHSDPKSDRFQLNANGSQGEQSELTYGVGTSLQNAQGEDGREAVSGNMSYRSPVGQFGMTAGVDNTGSSRQLSVSASGSVAAHKGGVTFGPSVGESPFAIIGAPGATGARVFNGQGAKVDRRGYAIMPSLTPYRENSVALDYKTVPENVDVMESQRTVIPREGAILAVDMKTIEGVPMVLIIHDENGQPIPAGSELLDDKGVSQGMSGQSGMAFVRGWDPASGNLWVVSGNDKCRIVPRVNNQNRVNASQSNSIVQMEVTCYRN
ncbi:fimbria/pilus outer membrane usher protein [Lelliottia wanjuensis]|uniref:Fimbria/pilus outer membrane usher protein n=1 Tax=Lelliottia wanjuensis TaxID=3050585 RepID=A0AAP4CYP2_9ENTR|nr:MULTISPECIES: fimbria/pilus outer membrane usher protein [unclassified Lelliottia]MDK9361824.1 fimbria/pilus outer membrane usher protein [Lelliottia sp. V106_12]MDK9618565.1 fimbria/pilus outer membrane usher protein [Lelliottia sp. V106_9]